MRTALVGVLDEFQLSPPTLSRPVDYDCTPAPLPPITRDSTHSLLFNRQGGINDEGRAGVRGSIQTRGIDSVVRITEFQSPSDPLTNFELKYSNAQRKLYNLEVDLGLHSLSDRERILNLFK